MAIGVLTGFGVDAVETGVGAQMGLAIFTPIVAALVIAVVVLIAYLTGRSHRYMLGRVAKRHKRARDDVVAFAAEE